MPARHPIVEWEPWKSFKIHSVPVNNFIIYYSIDDDKHIVKISRILYKGRDVESIINNTEK